MVTYASIKLYTINTISHMTGLFSRGNESIHSNTITSCHPKGIGQGRVKDVTSYPSWMDSLVLVGSEASSFSK